MKIINICILFFFVWGTAVGKGDADATQPIFPQQMTAHDLLRYCSSSSMSAVGRQRQRYCWGFISGVEETIRLTLNTSGQSAAKICVPKGISSRNMARAYIRYAGRRDTNLVRPAAQIVIEAFSSSYSCIK